MSRRVSTVTREDLSFRAAKTDTHTHSIHSYPAKFIPQIAEELVKKYSQPEARIADIFAGSGTTNLEAMLSSRHSFALDVNPLATLITQAKTAVVDPDILTRALQQIIVTTTNELPRITRQTDIIQQELATKNQERLEHWFPEQNIVSLAFLLHQIKQFQGADLQALLLLIFSSSLKLSSYWLDWSVKPQRDCRPVRPGNLADIDPDVHYRRVVPPSLEVFTKRAKEVSKKYVASSPLLQRQAAYRPEIVCADITEHPLAEGHFDAVITSPPYLTSYEYADLHQLSVFWLDDIQTVEEFKRRGFIGTKLQPLAPLPEVLLTSRALTSLRDVMRPAPQRHMDQYFSSMHNILEKTHGALRPGGQLCIVIGDSRYKGHEIPNHTIFLDILTSLNFSIEDVWERPIPRKRLTSLRDAATGRILPNALRDTRHSVEIYPTEHILILKK